MTYDPLRLFTIRDFTPTREQTIVATIRSTTFPWQRCRAMVGGHRNGAITISLKANTGAAGVWLRDTLEIEIRGDDDQLARTLCHELGHAVDHCVLRAEDRRDLLEIMHRPDNLWQPHHDEKDHPPSTWEAGFTRPTPPWQTRPEEAFADSWFFHYAFDVWRATGARERTFHRIVQPFEELHDILTRRELRLPMNRISGLTRYATSVAVSKHRFPDGAEVVYVATGNDWPDTVSAAALATDGPLLLVDGARVSDEVIAEVRRLAPKRIIAVGGTAAVPFEALEKLRTA